MNEEHIRELMSQTHHEALQAALDARDMDQEQADWMDRHMDQMSENDGGTGAGACHGGAATRTK